jgi:glycerol-3-phosphate dehydrogenase
VALNYTAAVRVIRNEKNAVCGVEAKDVETGQSAVLSTPAVINATGAWAESFHKVRETGMHLRPLRGSHLVIPAARIPLASAVTLVHPADSRPLFIIPWEGALILGTTDLDHADDLDQEVTATAQEADYMLECLNAYFPDANITLGDCVSSFAGIRPVLTKKDATDPSKESREHVIWSDNGLVTVTGGKLTTFRILARDALKTAAPLFPPNTVLSLEAPAFAPVLQDPAEKEGLSADTWRRLYGRYGEKAGSLVKKAAKQDLSLIPGTLTLWAELPMLAETEQIRHLTDLLLRRVRIGMLLPEGGKEHLVRIRQLCEPVLPWDSERWEKELKLYGDYIQSTLRVPGL